MSNSYTQAFYESFLKDAADRLREELNSEKSGAAWWGSPFRDGKALSSDVQGQIDKLSKEMNKHFTEAMVKAYKAGFKEIIPDTGAGFEHAVPGVVKSDRKPRAQHEMYAIEIENEMKLLWGQLKPLVDGSRRGKFDLDDLLKKIQKLLDESVKRMDRIYVLEEEHYHAAGQVAAYKKLGMKSYTIAVASEKPCHACESLDGQVFSLDKAEVGVNYPPMHPNCYCGIIVSEKEAEEVTSGATSLSQLSSGYMKWLQIAEGVTLHPYHDKADNQEAQNRQNVTLGFGFTFDNTGRNWDVLRKVLGWTDDEIKSIIKDVYDGKDLSSSKYAITEKQAKELFDKVNNQYVTDLNNAIEIFNKQNGYVTTYTQNQLEAMFDYSYNSGLSPDKDGVAKAINDPDSIFYYYLRKDLDGAVEAMKRFNGGNRRRLNQVMLFFKFDGTYNFIDSAKQEELDKMRKELGF